MKYIHFKLLLSLFVASIFWFDANAQSVSIDNATIKAKSDSIRIDSLKRIRAKNLFVEAGGAGLVFTLNYDVRFNKRRNGLGLRVGAGYLQRTTSDIFSSSQDPAYNQDPTYQQKYFTVPVQLNYLLGKKSHFAEFGVGTIFTMFNGSGRSSNNLFPIVKPGNQFKFINTLTIGYRYQPLRGGINFRVNGGFSYSAILFVPNAGLSVG